MVEISFVALYTKGNVYLGIVHWISSERICRDFGTFPFASRCTHQSVSDSVCLLTLCALQMFVLLLLLLLMPSQSPLSVPHFSIPAPGCESMCSLFQVGHHTRQLNPTSSYVDFVLHLLLVCYI